MEKQKLMAASLNTNPLALSQGVHTELQPENKSFLTKSFSYNFLNINKTKLLSISSKILGNKNNLKKIRFYFTPGPLRALELK